jgi:hypothetical protein
MTVELWYGSKPHHPAEQNTLIELYQFLLSQEEHFVVLLNFFPGQGNEIDLVVLKENGIFVAELKHIWDKILGGREGNWKAVNKEGQETVLYRGRPNPFKQIRRNYFSWKDWCNANAECISAGVMRPWPVDYEQTMQFIVLYPDLPEGSNLSIGDFPVQALGLSKFLPALVVRSSDRIGLSRQEMSRIPQLLKLTEWLLTPRPDTEKLSGDWESPTFVALAARGHALSVPLFRLDALKKEAITVGRESQNDLVIVDQRVSRYHAQIFRQGEHWVVHDLESTSGTFVSYSGDPVQEKPVKGVDFALKNGSIVRFGPASYTLLQYEG